MVSGLFGIVLGWCHKSGRKVSGLAVDGFWTISVYCQYNVWIGGVRCQDSVLAILGRMTMDTDMNKMLSNII